MSRRWRTGVFLAAEAGLGALLAWGFAGLPKFGAVRPSYGELLARVTVSQTHATNVVTAILYDYRALDTLGEEFILVAAVVGVAALLRKLPRPQPRRRGRLEEVGSEAIRLAEPRVLAATAVFAAYLSLHAHLTPGGGFQAGAMIAAVIVGVYLAFGYARVARVAPKERVDALEAIGAFGFATIGLGALLAGGAFLANVLPRGDAGTLLSSGTIAAINFAVWAAVSGGVGMLVIEFLEEEPQEG